MRQTKDLQRKLRKKWEYCIARKANLRVQKGRDTLWKIIALLEQLKPGRNKETSEQGFRDDETKLITYGEKGLNNVKTHFENLGNPNKSDKKHFNKNYKEKIQKNIKKVQKTNVAKWNKYNSRQENNTPRSKKSNETNEDNKISRDRQTGGIII